MLPTGRERVRQADDRAIGLERRGTIIRACAAECIADEAECQVRVYSILVRCESSLDGGLDGRLGWPEGTFCQGSLRQDKIAAGLATGIGS